MNVTLAPQRLPREGIDTRVLSIVHLDDELETFWRAPALGFGQRVVGVERARRPAREWPGHRFDPTSASADTVDAITGYEPRLAQE